MQRRMLMERQAKEGFRRRDETPADVEELDLNLQRGGHLQSPRWTRPLAPYAADQAASGQTRRTPSAPPRWPESPHTAVIVGGLPKLLTPDHHRIIRAVDDRQQEAAALAAVRAKVPDGPDISLLNAAARAASSAVRSADFVSTF